MEQGARDFETARGLFRRAAGIKPSPVTLSAMATLERRCAFNLEKYT